ncbi:hypothetical protein B0T25DRAFT_628751 [Lasiosphaeria hispida]|uniref:Uncharacterized protein n=1 Tax=Lasiosphaeria hispida TaxID=260671 RepID=A0AAJ0MHN0_9PEZI|nr:hypothetical protein B0T25DRAFT_628751 [Lasiosphaeria hispida]
MLPSRRSPPQMPIGLGADLIATCLRQKRPALTDSGANQVMRLKGSFKATRFYPIVVEEEEDKMSQLQQANFLQEFSTALCATAHHHEFDDIHSPLLTRSPPNLPLPNSTILPHQPTANSQLPKCIFNRLSSSCRRCALLRVEDASYRQVIAALRGHNTQAALPHPLPYWSRLGSRGASELGCGAQGRRTLVGDFMGRSFIGHRIPLALAAYTGLSCARSALGTGEK